MSIKLSEKPWGKNLYNLKPSRVFRYAIIPQYRTFKNNIWEVGLQNIDLAFQGNIITWVKGKTVWVE